MMNKRVEQLYQAKLYCVLDAAVCEFERLFDILDRCANKGVDIFQIRAKQSDIRDVLSFSRRAVRNLQGRPLFIVNDRVDVALASGADGVHVGQGDMPVGEARRLGGKDFIVGASCQTVEQARLAEEQGADYIGFGSVFKTLTKPDRSPMDLALLERVFQNISIPVFLIGGITCDNINLLRVHGAERFAVTRAVCLADNPVQEVKRFRELL